jgi:hypothetical protein
MPQIGERDLTTLDEILTANVVTKIIALLFKPPTSPAPARTSHPDSDQRMERMGTDLITATREGDK